MSPRFGGGYPGYPPPPGGAAPSSPRGDYTDYYSPVDDRWVRLVPSPRREHPAPDVSYL